VYERLGSPEGELAIAQAIVFMACAAKSNAVYAAFNAAKADARVSARSRSRFTCATRPRAMKDIGYGKAIGTRTTSLTPMRPVSAISRQHAGASLLRAGAPGLEIKIGEALAARRARDRG